MAENDEKSEFWEKADRIGWQAAFFFANPFFHSISDMDNKNLLYNLKMKAKIYFDVISRWILIVFTLFIVYQFIRSILGGSWIDSLLANSGVMVLVVWMAALTRALFRLEARFHYFEKKMLSEFRESREEFRDFKSEFRSHRHVGDRVTF